MRCRSPVQAPRRAGPFAVLGFALPFALTLTVPAAAQQHGDHAPVPPGPTVAHPSALSPEDEASLLEGRGMGLARAAEENHYPGPLHVLELAEPLGLTPAQRGEAERLRAAMLAEARPLGAALVAWEAALAAVFAEGRATPALVDALTAEIGALQGRLRAAHLRAHVAMRAALTPEQVARYDRLRGSATPPVHEHGAQPDPTDSGGGSPAGHGRHGGDGHGATAGDPGASSMSSALSPGAPMTRDGSGTAWLPDDAPMEAAHAEAGGWALMLHGAAFLRYTAQDAFDAGTRGSAGLGAPNWVMGMAQRPVGAGGQLTAKAMVSLDPITEGGDGYPLLFQSGETFEGERLVDRQHPHDLFSELSLTYAHRVAPGTAVFGYLAYPGEPAVGPVAFMHRPSARYNPDSPLGHHWQDATHIAFGVATLGLASGPLKLDASLFTGAEPDEARYGFDAPQFDSYSARLSYSPSRRLTLHAAHAFLKEPEALEPGVDQGRTTASALYAAPFGRDGDLSAALVWGANDLRPNEGAEGHHGGGVQHAFLAETTLRFGAQAVYGRAEYAQKSAEELALDAHAYGEEPFGLLALTLGGARDVFAVGGLAAMVGVQGSVFGVPEALRPLYGDFPVALQVYLRLSPARRAHGLSGHGSHGSM